ncbi:MAG: XdhC family protein [Anaerolineae bacterium]|nr:XdhC family protein [Anaerolineae bacterium]
MIDLLPRTLEWLANGERVAMATVVRVVGSAPRPVGARMVVSSAGRMDGSVSGGCVETTVYEELMDVLQGGPPRLLEFGITEDMIWDVGLACGGTIHVFCHELDPDLVDAFVDQADEAEPFALSTVLSGPAIGEVALVTGEGLVVGEARQAVIEAARAMLDARAPRGEVHRVAPGVEVFVEPFFPPPLLLIVGAVHVAIPLVRLAKELGFYVVVTDPREKFANRERFPEADEVWVEWPDEALAHLKVDDATYIVLLTHDPKIDEPTLAAALQTDAAYVGAIGSRGTHAARYERMARWGVTPEQLARVYGPVGLDLGGKTPAETALSIIAEVVAVKNGRPAGFLREGVARG